MATDLHPDFPVVSGDYALTGNWRVALGEAFNRRVDEGSLVLWRPDLTFWINVWNNEGQADVEEVLQRLLADAAPGRGEQQIERSGAMLRLSYTLTEGEEDALYGFVIYPSGYMQIAAYYDSREAKALAWQTIASVRSA
jgi:hypothetical protein